jgi:hypothetical protein
MSAPMDIERVTAGLQLLRQPFPENQINKLPKPYRADSAKGNCRECGGYHGLPALHLDFVGHAALTDRFLDADPQWTWEPLALDPQGLPAYDKNGGMWIKLTICGVTRLGYGDAQGKTGPNAIKEIIGDALRNAGMRFGAALDLWHKGDLHDAQTERGEENQDIPDREPLPDPRNLILADIKQYADDLGWSRQDVVDDFAKWGAGGDKPINEATLDTLIEYEKHMKRQGLPI